MGILHSPVEGVHPSYAKVHARPQVKPPESEPIIDPLVGVRLVNSQCQVASPDTERTLDPLIAARLQNDKHTPIFQLPEEVLLQIISHCCVDDSIVTLYCLRRVSRKFRRLVYEPSIWKHMLVPQPVRDGPYDTESHWKLPNKQRRQLEQHIRRDGLCTSCKLARLRRPWRTCKFYSETDRRLYCDGCGILHDIHEFSPSNTRQCLGRQGGVQICEHVHISWADIERHIAYWRRLKPQNYWESCIDSFNVECRDPSHDTHCMPGIPATWPRAFLGLTAGDTVSLHLQWEPHSRLRALAPTPDGNSRMPAPELRATFQRYRDGAGGIIIPSEPRGNSLPEMMCFARPGCDCVHYEDMSATIPDHDSLHGKERGWRGGCKAFHAYNPDMGKGIVSAVSIWNHIQAEGSVCVITAYTCRIPIFRKGEGKINPRHYWLHAMDPDTYPSPHTGYHQLYPCRNSGCIEYYRKRGAYHCGNRARTTYFPCKLCGRRGG